MNEPEDIGGPEGMSRRDFMLGGAALVAATAAALSPLRHLADFPTMDEFLQAHYQELKPKDRQRLIARVRRQVKKKYRVEANVSDPPPLPGVEFAMALDLSRCIGCRRCVHACVAENNQSRDPEIQYIRVLKLRKGSINLETAEHHYADDQVPDPDYYYMPVQCHHCRNAPCVKACPVQATWQEADGIVVIDYDWCIGCRYCMAACPYGARHFNFTAPGLASEQVNPDMGLLSNRPRPQGVVEKCHFCLHRTRQGKYPACLEACPVGARKFGNLLDPESEINFILKTKRVYVLKEELGTLPRFYYYFG